jgi:cytochrome c1
MQEPKDPRMSGKIAMYVLIFLAVFVTLFIWVA